jgi:hypothetical protein
MNKKPWYALVTPYNGGVKISHKHRNRHCGLMNRRARNPLSEIIILNQHSALTLRIPTCERCGVEKPKDPKPAWLDGVGLEPGDALRRRSSRNVGDPYFDPKVAIGEKP